jgi:hypothetical protein
VLEGASRELHRKEGQRDFAAEKEPLRRLNVDHSYTPEIDQPHGSS